MKTRYIFSMVLLMGFSQLLSAEQTQSIHINFHSPEKFTDFQSRENRTTKDQERLMNQMRKLMSQSIMSTLKKDMQLNITVNDVDMAGRYVYPGGSIDLRTNVYNNNTQAVRVVKNTDQAKLDFDFELLDSSGAIIKKGHKKITASDLNFSGRSKLKYKNSNFRYLMPVFDVWLKKL